MFTKENFIWLDMDGVLADFDSWVWSRLDRENISNNQMWAWFQTQERPFFQFDPMPDAQLLWEQVHAMAPGRVQILTALPLKSSMPNVEQDKKEWLEKHRDIFPDTDTKFNVGPYAADKYKHCLPGDVLIDDSVKNIVDWNCKGRGFGIHHTSTLSSLELLDAYLNYSAKIKL